MAANMCLKFCKNYSLSNHLFQRKTIPNSQLFGSFFSRARSTEESSKQTGEAEATTAAPPTGDAPPTDADRRLQEEKDKLTAQLNELQDKYKRSLAENENVRQRMRKQADDARLFGIQGFCKDLLEVADVLHKAVESVPAEVATSARAGDGGSSSHFKDLFDGLTMTEGQLQKVFNRHGMYQICPQEGDDFDPNLHEALYAHPVEGKAANTIMAVDKIGYRLHDRTIRPALVGVYK